MGAEGYLDHVHGCAIKMKMEASEVKVVQAFLVG